MKTAWSLLIVGLLLGCAHQPRESPPTPAEAATPAEAYSPFANAVLDGDEATARRYLVVRSPHGWADADVRFRFATRRLERATVEHRVNGERTRHAGWDRGQTLSPNFGGGGMDPRTFAAAREAATTQRWTIDGDIARPTDKPEGLRFGRGTQLSVERVDGQWRVVLSDPPSISEPEKREQVRLFVKTWNARARAADEATEKIITGELTSFRAVNDFLDSRTASLLR